MTDYEIEMELEAALEALPKENPPVNLSDWNSGSDYKEKLASVVKLGKKSDLFNRQRNRGRCRTVSRHLYIHPF